MSVFPAWEGSQSDCSWHDWIPGLFFPEWMSASEKCPVVKTATPWLTTPPATHPFFHRGWKNPLHSAFHLLFSQKSAAHLTCAYPRQYLLLSLFFLEDQEGTLSCDGDFIVNPACSAVLNINGFRTSGCLLVWAPLIKKPIRNSWANPTFQFENCGDQLEKDNEDLKMFSCSFFFY